MGARHHLLVAYSSAYRHATTFGIDDLFAQVRPIWNVAKYTVLVSSSTCVRVLGLRKRRCYVMTS
jgi:hypothetical protein